MAMTGSPVRTHCTPTVRARSIAICAEQPQRALAAPGFAARLVEVARHFVAVLAPEGGGQSASAAR